MTDVATAPPPSTNGVHENRKRKLSKNQQKRLRAKEKKQQGSREVSVSATESASEAESISQYDEVKEEPGSRDFDMQDIASVEIELDDPAFSAYKDIFQKFKTEDEDDVQIADSKGDIYYSDDDEQDEEQEAAAMEQVMSKKKLRKLHKISIAQLKALSPRPDIVEWFDSDAVDPLLLVRIKAAKNVVPVPAHWSVKREYLSSKRGVEKPPFELPDFIKHTGIMDMRDNTKEDDSTLRQRMRERVQPKMGRLDIDYQRLHDAFFKFQTKPKLTTYGEVYYEGKEFEANPIDRRPGVLSDELKQALSIPPGAPPPWLLNMQRVGPPPSYPGLKIPGLNAPIPAGAQWGFHPGGYGKPPVDEATNRPLYGDVFGVVEQQGNDENEQENIDRSVWGELQPDEEGEEEEEEEEPEEEERTVGIDELEQYE